MVTELQQPARVDAGYALTQGMGGNLGVGHARQEGYASPAIADHASGAGIAYEAVAGRRDDGCRRAHHRGRIPCTLDDRIPRSPGTLPRSLHQIPT